MKPITQSLRPRNWTRKRINRELKARGTSQADLTRLIGKSQGLISEVVAGHQKSLPVAVVIAAALGLRPCDIWPRLYAPPAAPSAEPMTAATAEPAPRALAS